MDELLTRDMAEEYAEWFRTLSDATRIQLLAWLARQPQPTAVRDIVEVFPLSQSTVSHHLAALARTCFVTVEKRGTSSYYAVNPRCLEELPAAAELLMNGRARFCCQLPTEAVEAPTSLKETT